MVLTKQFAKWWYSMKDRFLNFTILIFFLLFGSSLVAGTTTKDFSIQGGYDNTISLVIEPIAAQTVSYIAGMPFNIQDNQVKYDQISGGRQIARWSVVSNTLFTITVKANPLHPVDDTSINLDYILTFKYDLSSADGSYEDQGFEVSSDKTEHEFVVGNLSSMPESSFLGILEGGILFKFTEGGWNLANSSESPSGNYITTVTVKLVAR